MFVKVDGSKGHLTWMGALLIVALAFGVVFLTFHGMFNIVLPGEKKLSKKCAKRRALYIATVAQTGASNASQSGGFVNKPTKLPLSLHDEDSDD